MIDDGYDDVSVFSVFVLLFQIVGLRWYGFQRAKKQQVIFNYLIRR